MNPVVINKNKILIVLLTFIVPMLVLSFSVRNVYAGDINGNEAAVIAAAGGTFEYEGKYYRAESQYMNELYAYLSRDDIDLTDKQANTAIRMMYRNIRRGVKEGYLYEIKSEEPTTEDSTGSTTEKTTGNADEPTAENPDSKTTTSTSEAVEPTTGETTTEKIAEYDDYNYLDNPGSTIISYSDFMDDELDSKEEKIFAEEFFDAIETQTQNNQTLSNRPTATESDAVVRADKDGISFDSGDTSVDIKLNEKIVPSSVITALFIIPIVLFAITIICSVILLLSGCMRFKKKDRTKRERGHTRRSNIRKVNRVILTITSSFSITCLLLTLSIMIGLCNDVEIMSSVQGSGYYRYAYIEYLADKDSSEEFKGYEDFMIQQKQKEEKMLDGNMDVSEEEYASAIPYVVSVREEIKASVIFSSIIYALTILIAFVVMIFMDIHRTRGVRSIAVAEIAAGVLVIIATIMLFVINVPARVYIDPDHLYIFFTNAYKWMERVFVIVSAFMVIIGMSLVGLYKTKRKDG